MEREGECNKSSVHWSLAARLRATRDLAATAAPALSSFKLPSSPLSSSSSERRANAKLSTFEISKSFAS